jgi:hypothetical protein
MQANVIDVTPKLIDNVISWELCYKNTNTCGVHPNFPVVELTPGKVDQMFVVRIKDSSNLGITFPPTLQEAFWIQADDKPLGPVIEPKSQILSPTLVDKSMLVFIDKNNGSKKDLKYQLNFVDSNNKAVTAIDPDIKNGGGRSLVYGAAELLGAFVIGAALVLAITVLRVRRMRAHAAPIRNPAS